MSGNPYRRNSKRYLIADLLLSGNSRTSTYTVLRGMVENQQRPMVFSANVNGRRVAKPIASQLVELRHEINRVAKLVNRIDPTEEFDPENIEEGEGEFTSPAPSEEEREEEEEEPDTEEEEEPEEEEEKPHAAGKSKIADLKRFFLAEVRRIREFCKAREMAGEKIDHISMRPVIAAEKLIPAGLPPEALLHAMTLHWPEDARRDAAIPPFDVVKLSREIMGKREIETVSRPDGSEEIPHDLFGYVLVLAENRQPIMAIGPAGTGKSHLAHQVADYLEMRYAETPMTPGATRGDLLGRHTITGFIPAEFCTLYSGGGVFNFEEIDASDPSMLIVLNNALSSKSLYNSVNGEMFDKHPDFVAFSTANTFGLGATREYTGREKLDAATVDRWRMGRVWLDLDNRLEESLLGVS